MGEEMCLNWSHLLVIISRLAHWLFAVVSVNDSSSMHCVSRLYLGWTYCAHVHMPVGRLRSVSRVPSVTVDLGF